MGKAQSLWVIIALIMSIRSQEINEISSGEVYDANVYVTREACT